MPSISIRVIVNTLVVMIKAYSFRLVRMMKVLIAAAAAAVVENNNY